MRIEDGKGSGLYAEVDSNFRIATTAITEEQLDKAGDDGDKYNINTGDITLTDAAITTVLFLKNNEDRDLIITALIYNLGTTASGSGDVKVEVLRNPTTGDIVTNANAVEAKSNQNFSSNKTLTADAYKGATSEAVIADGAVSISTRSAANTGRIFLSLGRLVLPKGASLAINYTPPASNTSQICQFAVAAFLRESV